MIRNLLCMTAPVRDGFDIPCHELGPASSQLSVSITEFFHRRSESVNGAHQALAYSVRCVESIHIGQQQ